MSVAISAQAVLPSTTRPKARRSTKAGQLAGYFRTAFSQMTGAERFECAKRARRGSKKIGSVQRVQARETVVGRLWSRWEAGRLCVETAESFAAAVAEDLGGPPRWGTGPGAVDNAIWEMAEAEYVEYATWIDSATNENNVTVPTQTPREIHPGRSMLRLFDDLVEKVWARTKPARHQRPRKVGVTTSTDVTLPAVSTVPGTAEGRDGPP